MRYPISHNRGKQLGSFFYEILMFHVPPSKDTYLLDPTCGKKHLWVDFFKPNLYGKKKLEQYGKIIFSDKIDYGQDIVSDIKDLEFFVKFDCIVYDPPYFFGYHNSKDPRREDYGDYTQTYDELLWYMNVANNRFPKWLKKNGKLIVKCSDQYQTSERKFYPHHYTWINRLNNFQLIDLFLFIHHRISPTAFQVKERPCSIIMHTFFLVFSLKKNIDFMQDNMREHNLINY